ncbi:hypothetical protein OF83DRAFT_1175625 [Amylostereum chailletii]|nr:hypothetical protein OF83DRAFT_1175625 [Amylostereum chailletii]
MEEAPQFELHRRLPGADGGRNATSRPQSSTVALAGQPNSRPATSSANMRTSTALVSDWSRRAPQDCVSNELSARWFSARASGSALRRDNTVDTYQRLATGPMTRRGTMIDLTMEDEGGFQFSGRKGRLAVRHSKRRSWQQVEERRISTADAGSTRTPDGGIPCRGRRIKSDGLLAGAAAALVEHPLNSPKALVRIKSKTSNRLEDMPPRGE